MMAVCPVCGKLKVIHWPEFWIYRRGNNYYCCENCMDIQMSKDLNLLHDVLRKRRKGALNMARMKKDGTPAKKPGRKPNRPVSLEEVKKDKETAGRVMKQVSEAMPKPIAGGDWEKAPAPMAELKLNGPVRIETPEAKNVQVVETPEKVPFAAGGLLPKVILPETCQGMMIREVEGMFGRYRLTDIGTACYIDFENTERMDTLSFTVEQWRKFREEQEKAARILGVEL